MVNPADAPLEVAAASVDLTPPAGLPLGGYMLRRGQVASGAHDPLVGSLLWLRDRHGGQVLWVALDAVGVDRELADAIASAVAVRSGCPADAVVVCATHTHSGAAGLFRGLAPFLPDETDGALREGAVDRVAAAADGLASAFTPCWPVFAEGHAPEAGGNRDDPAGPHDDSVGILGLFDASGRVVAALVDFASHATVLGHANLAWSADWPGATRRLLAAALATIAPFASSDDVKTPAIPPGGAPTIVVLQGAAGDASPRFVRRSQTFGEVDRLGGLVAAAAAEALLAAEPGTAAAPIAVHHRSVQIPTRPVPDPVAATRLSADAEQAWLTARDSGAPAPRERIARTRFEGTMVLTRIAEVGLPPTIEPRISVVSVGDAAWVHLPVELFASYGLTIRAASPFGWTRVIGYTDGYLGYVADAAAHAKGVYESYASHLDPAGGQALTDAAIGLLQEAAGARAEPAAAQ